MNAHFLKLPVDPSNPGQVLACCGLVELVSRVHGPTASRFQTSETPAFFIHASRETVQDAVEALKTCPVEFLDDDRLHLDGPFDLRLDWWHDKAHGASVPKTWAGGVRPKTFFPPYQKALEPRKQDPAAWWDLKLKLDSASPCLDPREFVHSLDTGFSPYEVKASVWTFPYVEILAFIGVQRFRPASETATSETAMRNAYSYYLWEHGLLPTVAALLFSGNINFGNHTRFIFRLRPRDQENRYKAWTFSHRKEEKE
ncbi:MAG: hypothetical protein ACP5NF_11920 [Thermoanaerobaculum sp.]